MPSLPAEATATRPFCVANSSASLSASEEVGRLKLMLTTLAPLCIA